MYISTGEEQQITRQLAGLLAPELSKLGHDYVPNTDVRYADYPGVYLDGPNGAQLYLRVDDKNTDRVVVRGVYPRNGMYGLEHYRITVARDRGPAVIAREILRRLLPGYLAQMAAIVVDNNERSQARAARLTLAKELASLLNGTIERESDDSTQTNLRFYNDPRGYGDIRINYRADSVEMKLSSLPADLAHTIALVIHDWNPEA